MIDAGSATTQPEELVCSCCLIGFEQSDDREMTCALAWVCSVLALLSVLEIHASEEVRNEITVVGTKREGSNAVSCNANAKTGKMVS